MGDKKRQVHHRIVLPEQYVSGSSFLTANVPLHYINSFDRTGANDPMYKDKIEKVVSASNYMKVIAKKIEISSDTLYFRYTGPVAVLKGKEFYTRFPGTLPAHTNDSDALNGQIRADAKNASAIGIRKRIADEQAAFSGLTFLGELRETISLIRNPAAKLREFTQLYLYKQLVNKRFMRKRSFAKALSESWLEFSFGAMPLINDISAIATAALGQIEERRIKRLSFTGSADSSLSHVIQYNRGGVVGSYKIQRDIVRRARHFYTVGYEVDVPQTESSCQSIINQGNFNLRDILPTAWELLPWSFFIDYFSNIGDLISTSMVSLEKVRWVNSVSVVNTTEHHHGLTLLPDSNRVYSRGKMPEVKAMYDRVEREAHPSIPFGTLRFELPGRNAQFLNIAALARLQFK